MDKQRLLELAGITEAKYASSDTKYVVVTYGDADFNVVGPFNSKTDAERYVKWEIEEFELIEEYFGKVTAVMNPEW